MAGAFFEIKLYTVTCLDIYCSGDFVIILRMIKYENILYSLKGIFG